MAWEKGPLRWVEDGANGVSLKLLTNLLIGKIAHPLANQCAVVVLVQEPFGTRSMSLILFRVILGAKTENGRTYIRTKYVNDEMGAWTPERWVFAASTWGLLQ